MIVSIDGHAPLSVLNDVKVVLGEGSRQVHVTITHEGVITDLVDDSNIVATSSVEHDSLEPEACKQTPTPRRVPIRGDGAHRSPSDLYDRVRNALAEALVKGGDFDTDWYSVKHECQSGKIWRRAHRVGVEVSVTDDFDTRGSSEGIVDVSTVDLSTIEAALAFIEGPLSVELDKTLDAAVDSQKDNAAVDLYVVGRDNQDGTSRWTYTFLAGVENMDGQPPGDAYHRWGWQEVDTDDDQDVEAFPEEIGKETADKIRNTILDGEAFDDRVTIDGWVVRRA